MPLRWVNGRRRLLALSVTAALLPLAAPHVGAAADLRDHTGAYANRTRRGEDCRCWALSSLAGHIAPMQTVEAGVLSHVERVAVARLFGVRPAAIRHFRWGRSMAPPLHRLAGTMWYTIWYADELRPQRRSLTVRLARDNRIIEIAER
jgi:hypothetical protein